MDLTNEQIERYSRQLILKEAGASGQKKLAQGHVFVIGAGGLGSAALLYLAAAGVGTLRIADHDEVELSNLNRQILHATSRLGRSKADSACQALRDLNPDIRLVPYPILVTPENMPELIRDYDIVLDCTDRFETKLMINDVCVREGKPFVHAGILGVSGQIMTWIPGSYPCLRCLTGNDPAPETETCATAGILGAAAGVMGTLQALEAIKFLLGKGDLLTGRMLHFDGMSLTFSETLMPRRSPYCRTCGTPSD